MTCTNNPTITNYSCRNSAADLLAICDRQFHFQLHPEWVVMATRCGAATLAPDGFLEPSRAIGIAGQQLTLALGLHYCVRGVTVHWGRLCGLPGRPARNSLDPLTAATAARSPGIQRGDPCTSAGSRGDLPFALEAAQRPEHVDLARRDYPEACARMCYRARHGAMRDQMSGLSWIRAPGRGCFGILIVGCPATACLRVPSG